MSQEVERTVHERPRTGYRNRPAAEYYVQSTHHTQQRSSNDHGSRPKSSRGRRMPQESRRPVEQQTHSNAPLTQENLIKLEQQSRTSYVPLKDDSQQSFTMERPKSSRGRSREPVLNDEPQMPMERPKSSSGRPDYDMIDQSEEWPVDGNVSPTRRARPKSAKGRNRSAYGRQPVAQSRQQEADVLVVNHDPVPEYTSYGQTSQFAQSEFVDDTHAQQPTHEYGDYQRRQSDPWHAESTQPPIPYQERAISHTERPMSGRPGSSRPPTAAERKILQEGVAKDNEILRTGTPLGGGRPDSASSFSRYSILPSIGNPSSGQVSTPPIYKELMPREPSAGLYRQRIQRELNTSGGLAPKTLYRPAENTTQSPVSSPAKQSESLGLAPIKIPTETDSPLTPRQSSLEEQAFVETHSSIEETPYTQNEQVSLTPDVHPQPTTTVPTVLSPQHCFQALAREIHLHPEPQAGPESLLLAIKLPDGRRVQRQFLRTHTLQTVLEFAEYSSRLDFTGTEMVCDAPRRQVFSDLSKSLADTGLQHRTVLHIQLPDSDL